MPKHPHSSHSSSGAGPSRPRPRPLEQRDPSGIPGISKLKASIRQTKRLLAKDTLEPGLKISTERRLKSLEADLVKAEQREVEKKYGGRYHRIKFFERQKILRLIKRFKRQSGEDGSKAKGKKSSDDGDATTQLEEARVMLNYVLHFPYDQKYISLFPSTSSSSADTEDSKLVLPHLLPSASQADLDDTKESLEKGDRRRLEILLKTREMMRSGELSSEPENEMDDPGQGKKGRRVTVALSQQDRGFATMQSKAAELGDAGETRQTKSDKKRKRQDKNVGEDKAGKPRGEKEDGPAQVGKGRKEKSRGKKETVEPEEADDFFDMD